MTITPKISLKKLHKQFGSKVVLDAVNLDVMPGESMVIIGGSGSGKSVTLKCILGLLTPESGSIKIDGVELVGIRHSERKEILTKFGMLFQGGALFDSLPVWENVAFGLLAQKKINRKDAQELAIEKLRRVGLSPDVAMLSPAELSGGMQKRVGLARAIAAEPEIIFFDEPTTGLDPIMSDVINELIVECVKEVGATTLTITHDMASVRKIADKVSMIYHGNMIWTGAKNDIDNSGNEYIEQFIHGRAEGPIKMEILKS
ncbi:MAG: ATP-binding cassette domain-containing protein [Proteobacteria bacterium]|jgi:phospholipid/cholesterol/gamma-HCH transport system ATP-binding protein|nr:ATP-binding cassette domain-containing protein [Pseudomonadota bacterium]